MFIRIYFERKNIHEILPDLLFKSIPALAFIFLVVSSCVPTLYKEDMGFQKICDKSNAECFYYPPETRYLGFKENFCPDVNTFGEFPKMETLEISSKCFNDEDLKGIRVYKKLTFLNLNHTSVTNVSPLKELTNLNAIILSSTDVEDLSLLKDLKKITRLKLDSTKITDLSFCRYFPELRHLDIRDTAVKDLSGLASNSKLMDLQIGKTYVMSLKEIYHLKDLMYLEIDDTKITEEEIKNFRAKLPYAKIVRRGR